MVVVILYFSRPEETEAARLLYEVWLFLEQGQEASFQPPGLGWKRRPIYLTDRVTLWSACGKGGKEEPGSCSQ